MKIDVCRIPNVGFVKVIKVAVDEVRRIYANKIDAVVLEVATQDPAKYWRIGETCYLDDPFYGPVASLDDFRYHRIIGLHHDDKMRTNI